MSARRAPSSPFREPTLRSLILESAVRVGETDNYRDRYERRSPNECQETVEGHRLRKRRILVLRHLAVVRVFLSVIEQARRAPHVYVTACERLRVGRKLDGSFAVLRHRRRRRHRVALETVALAGRTGDALLTGHARTAKDGAPSAAVPTLADVASLLKLRGGRRPQH